ncbi:uncharacterized protein LOC142772031 [Rhipicephalus microplus]|uniref:uncharacterized protein LOC142772031 n=1 Tax=Rhipicephalus microplus TaxID=6941 RepID=UPI003F6B0776
MMAPVIKKEALGASASFPTADSRRSQEAKKFELGKVVHFAGKETTERKWQSWWDWHCERQNLKRQTEAKPEPEINQSQSRIGKKPARPKCEKPDHTADDEWKISYLCQLCSELFLKKHDLEWHLREHTGVRPLPCGLCPMKFLNGRLLAAHHTRHHKLGSK